VEKGKPPLPAIQLRESWSEPTRWTSVNLTQSHCTVPDQGELKMAAGSRRFDCCPIDFQGLGFGDLLCCRDHDSSTDALNQGGTEREIYACFRVLSNAARALIKSAQTKHLKFPRAGNDSSEPSVACAKSRATPPPNCARPWRDCPALRLQSLYLHVPFCVGLCLYCGCHTKAVRRRDPIDRYVSWLIAEIDSSPRTFPAVALPTFSGAAERHQFWAKGA
jgi:hypothetical protein